MAVCNNFKFFQLSIFFFLSYRHYILIFFKHSITKYLSIFIYLFFRNILTSFLFLIALDFLWRLSCKLKIEEGLLNWVLIFSMGGIATLYLYEITCLILTYEFSAYRVYSGNLELFFLVILPKNLNFCP